MCKSKRLFSVVIKQYPDSAGIVLGYFTTPKSSAEELLAEEQAGAEFIISSTVASWNTNVSSLMSWSTSSWRKSHRTTPPPFQDEHHGDLVWRRAVRGARFLDVVDTWETRTFHISCWDGVRLRVDLIASSGAFAVAQFQLPTPPPFPRSLLALDMPTSSRSL